MDHRPFSISDLMLKGVEENRSPDQVMHAFKTARSQVLLVWDQIWKLAAIIGRGVRKERELCELRAVGKLNF